MLSGTNISKPIQVFKVNLEMEHMLYITKIVSRMIDYRTLYDR